MIHRKIYVEPPRMSYGGSILSSGASMAGTGMMIGGPVGAGVGALAGGLMGFFTERANQRALEDAKKKQEEMVAKQQLAMNRNADQQILSQFPTYGVNTSYAKNGGVLNPEFNAEGGEIIEHSSSLFAKPKTDSNGYLERLSDTTSKIKGKSHKEGGINMSGGERIFSDKLPAPIQFLKQAKKL